MKHLTLVTWSGTGNFGTSLQAYALERIFEKLGYRVSLLSELDVGHGWRAYARWVRWLLGLDSLGRAKNFLPYRKEKFLAWKRRHLHELIVFNGMHLRLLRWRTSVYVTGSDQIWNTYVEFSPVRFLSFAGNGRRIAYASSIGTDSVNPEFAEEVRKLLLKFDVIGVREQAAVEALSKLTGRTDIQKVLDPTFLLSASEWNELAKGAKFERPMPKRYMVCYLIGSRAEYAAQLNSVMSKTGIRDVVYLPSLESPKAEYDGVTAYPDATPSEFVHLIANADFVCTDSFHATVMSIVFEKDFVEFLRFPRDDVRSQNSRLDELLGRYRLLDRYFERWFDGGSRNVDYSAVREMVARDKQASESFLLNALGRVV